MNLINAKNENKNKNEKLKWNNWTQNQQPKRPRSSKWNEYSRNEKITAIFPHRWILCSSPLTTYPTYIPLHCCHWNGMNCTIQPQYQIKEKVKWKEKNPWNISMSVMIDFLQTHKTHNVQQFKWILLTESSNKWQHQTKWQMN